MEEVYEFGRRLQSDGHYSEAEKCYRRYLEDHANSFQALNNLGVVLECQDQVDEAIRYFRAASDLVPKDAIPRYNLGNALFKLERFEAAIDVFESLIETSPEHGPAQLNLGVCYWRTHDFNAAQKCFEHATSDDAVAASAHSKLGLLYFETGRYSLARDSHVAAAKIQDAPEHSFHAALCDKTLNNNEQAAERLAHVIDLDPTSRIAHEHRVRSLMALNDHASVLDAFGQWDQNIPSDPICKHMKAAFIKDDSVTRCSEEYVRDTFSGFAGDFNETLQRLEYKAPQILSETLINAVGKDHHFVHVLDAGCGTGLCGKYVKTMCSKLTGVDLAAPMLEQARPLNVYDELIESDLIKYLQSNKNSVDAIISADTFNYFGALDNLLDSCADALTAHGHLAFTLEHSDEGADEYKLMPHGRFQHARTYIEKTISEAGFNLISFNTFVMRRESGNDVKGWVIHGQKV